MTLLTVATAARASDPAAGQLWAFGNNNAAQLGNETNVETQNANLPVPVTLPQAAGRVVEAVAGGPHTLVNTESGNAYAFGWNYHGELGNSTYIEGNGPHGWNPVPALIELPGQEGPIVQVEGGSGFSFALTESGQLYAFGNNSSGQLGNETNINQITGKANPTPTLVALPGQDGPVVEVAAGIQHTLVLTDSGQLYSFGNNSSGQLGRETTAGPQEWSFPTPTLLTLPGEEGPVVQIAVGRESSFAVTESGQLYAFGNNRFGQLGFEENSGPGPDPFENNHPTPTLVSLPGDEPVAEVAGGAFHTLALSEDGQLYAFGKNTLGALGNSTNIENQAANPTPTPIDLPGGAGEIEKFTAGYEDSFVLTSTGRLYSFGWNYFAELGRATNNKTLKPNPVPTVVPMPAGAALETVGTGVSASHTLAVIGMVMTTGSLPVVTEGTPYEDQLVVEGGEAPYEWSAKGLPAGLSVDEASGEVSGTPTATCSQAQCKYAPTFTVVEAGGMEVSRTVTMTLAPETPPGKDPGGGDPPPGDPPPVEEDVPAQARLRIGGVHLAAGAKLWIGGSIVKVARGAVTVRAVAHRGGRRITVSRAARIADGHWRVRLPLSAGRPGDAVRLSASFGGSPGVESGHARRRVQFKR